jgi:glutathione synthase/RimK-type ligase-like ATP-grasp enzyme
MKFLIPTEPDDTHAILVSLALQDMGYVVTPLFTADHPTQQKNSVFIDMSHYQWKSIDDYEEIIENNYDVVWWRRARKPYLPKESVHTEDYAFVARENILFFESFTSNLAPNAWWINSKEAAQRANFKLLQLKIASECGFVIPTTLCSNDPQEIKQFIAEHEASGVVYKPMCSHFWFESTHTKISYTARVHPQELPQQQVLQKVPGIFQVEMKKKFELRVTCFGDYVVAAKLNSQKHPDGIVDWRAIRGTKMLIEPYELPESVAQSIRLFMHRLGIVFGSFDFIVTPDDAYVFLEVNEQGQFLWIEEYNPQFKMLDMFIQFIVNATVDFQWDEQQCEHTIERYRTRMQAMYNRNMQRHVGLNTPKTQYA